MYYVEGGICIVSADFLAVPVANSSYKIGTLPNGVKPLGHVDAGETGSGETAYIAPLRHRGDNSKYGQMMVSNSGEITAFVSDAESGSGYYYGSLVFPVTTS